MGPPSSKYPFRLAAPWQGWEPESNFLSELHKWNIAHKDDKLPAILSKVNSILESDLLQAALECIPNSPFPAKSLVKTMISLFLLGSVSDVCSQTSGPTYTCSSYIIHLENSSGEAGHPRLCPKGQEGSLSFTNVQSFT